MRALTGWRGELVEELFQRAQRTSVLGLHALIVERLAARIGCDSAILVPSLERRLTPSSVNKGSFAKLHRLYYENPARYDPGFRKGRAATSKHGAYIDTELYTLSERRNLPFYADIIRPQGIASQLIASLGFRGHSGAAIHLCRHGRGRFRASDLDAVRAVLPFAGLIEASASLLVPPGQRFAASPCALLAERERQVAQLASRGLSNREIAGVLDISAATVRNHLHHVFRKLEVSTRAELAFLLAAKNE